MARTKAAPEKTPEVEIVESRLYEAVDGGQFGGFTWRRGDRHLLRTKDVPVWLKFIRGVKK